MLMAEQKCSYLNATSLIDLTHPTQIACHGRPHSSGACLIQDCCNIYQRTKYVTLVNN